MICWRVSAPSDTGIRDTAAAVQAPCATVIISAGDDGEASGDGSALLGGGEAGGDSTGGSAGPVDGGALLAPVPGSGADPLGEGPPGPGTVAEALGGAGAAEAVGAVLGPGSAVAGAEGDEVVREVTGAWAPRRGFVEETGGCEPSTCPAADLPSSRPDSGSHCVPGPPGSRLPTKAAA
ncbi:hypothetical protein [Streptomyces sp. NPDC018693]|uniref:hypothetical protein n=1 Tax=unclassified Streptomyces TaxID=2593676 RepID=UPI0037BAED83